MVRKNKNEAEEIVPVEETLEAPIEETPVEEINFPQVTANGRYQAVKFGEGYVVYNPIACRVSSIITLTEANDVVRQQNQAAHIKG